MKKVMVWLLLAVALGWSLPDIDVTGKWTGTLDIPGPDGKDSTAVLNLKQKGAEITGTAGPGEDEQLPIKNGKIEGDKISLDVENNGRVIHFAMVVAEDRITGEATMNAGGETHTAKIAVSRSK